MKKKIEEIFISECGCITWAYCDHRKRKLLSLFDKTVSEVIGEDKPTNTGLPMIDEPNIYHNITIKMQRLRYKEMREGKNE